MNKFEQEGNRRIAFFEQQKAAIRLECLRFFDRLSLHQMRSVIDEISEIKTECDSCSGGRAVVIQIGLLEFDILLSEWMASKGNELNEQGEK